MLLDFADTIVCAAAQATRQADEPVATTPRRCNRNFAALALRQMLLSVLLLVDDVLATIDAALALLARTTKRVVHARSSPRPKHHVKPHARFAYKG